MARQEQVLSVEHPIEIISSELAGLGIFFLQQLFDKTFPDPASVSLAPIRLGGDEVGAMLSRPAHGRFFKRNPMRMSFYDRFNNRLDHPRVVADPDLALILDRRTRTTRDVVFAEAVVDSQATVLAAQARIRYLIDQENKRLVNQYPYPTFHTFALINKSQPPIQIANLHAAYQVNSDIWVYGRWCDSHGGKGRKSRSIMGTLSPSAKTAPEEPYATLTPEMELWMSTLVNNLSPLFVTP